MTAEVEGQLNHRTKQSGAGNGKSQVEPKKASRKKTILPDEFEKRAVHPALHIEPGFASVGIVVRRGGQSVPYILTANDIYSAESLKDTLTTRAIGHPGFIGRYRPTKNPPSLAHSVALLIEKIKGLVWFEDPRWYPTVALWTAGTYLFPAFPTYPYLQLTGEKGTAKTKLLNALELVAFNGLIILEPTPAVLFRIVHALRPTLLIDEAEKIRGEDGQEVRGIINAGYKRGATVPRCEGESHDLKFFEVYGPKCLAAIRGLGAVTEDRCITIVMTKPAIEDHRQNLPINPLDPDWQIIRDGFYRLPFTHGERLFKEPEPPVPTWLRARDRELWLPLIRLANMVDKGSNLDLTPEVIQLARESAQEKGLTFDAEAVLGLLESLPDHDDILTVRPIDLIPQLEESLNRRGRVSPQWVAERLRAFGFRKAGRDKHGVFYEIPAVKLTEIRCRYTPPECFTPLHTPDSTSPQAPKTKEKSPLGVKV